MRILNLILKRPVGTIMLWLGLVFGGLWAAFGMRVDFLPDFTVPKLTVISTWQGLPAEEIRRMITIPLEDSLSSLGGLRSIRSISRDSLSLIELEFPWGTKHGEAGLKTRGVLDLAWHNLPSDASRPQVLAMDPGDLPIVILGVFPKNGSLSLARRLSDRELRSRLQRIEGVGSIQVSGGLIDEVCVDVDPARLTGLGYTLQEVASALSGSNIDYPAGTVTEGITEYLVKTRSRVENVSELADIFLPPAGNNASSAPVRLKDLASLRPGEKKQRSFYFSAEMDEGVMIRIRRTAGFSPAAMAENIRSELDDIRRSFGGDLEINIISDRSDSLRRSMRDLALSLISGACFAFIVIYIFMRNLPKALLLLISLPSSLLLAVLMLYLSGKSLNLMSLGGLALGVGMVVDNAIVVTERLGRIRMSALPPEERIGLISRAAAELAPSLAGSTLTTVIVFTPLLLVKGLLGSLFADLGLSVIFSLSSSLFLSLSLIPVLYLKLNPKDSRKRCSSRLAGKFRKLLKTGIRRPVSVISAVAACCILGIIPAARLPLQVITPINEGIIRCSLKTAPGTSMESVKALAREIAGSAAALPGVEAVNLWAGGENTDPYYLASAGQSSETIQIMINHGRYTDATLLKKRLAALLEMQNSVFEIKASENILANLIGIDEGADWVVKGDDPESVRQTAEELIAGIADAHLVPAERKTRILIYPDRKALSSFGVDISGLTQHISGAVAGTLPTTMLINGEETDVRLRIAESVLSERGDILELNIPGGDSVPVRLSSIISMQDQQTLPYLLREGRKDLSVIRFKDGAGKAEAGFLRNNGAEPGEPSVIAEQLPEIIMMLVLALFLLYLSLGIQFESFSLPLLLMLSIPPGGAGIVTALFLSGGSVNLNSCLGIFVVMGISVNNGILLYEEARRRSMQPGSLPLGALYRGTLSRLSPIMMTSLTTITALVPLAVDPFGSSSQSTLAVSIIGGLGASAFISLLILPNIIRARLGRQAA